MHFSRWLPLLLSLSFSAIVRLAENWFEGTTSDSFTGNHLSSSFQFYGRRYQKTNVIYSYAFVYLVVVSRPSKRIQWDERAKKSNSEKQESCQISSCSLWLCGGGQHEYTHTQYISRCWFSSLSIMYCIETGDERASLSKHSPYRALIMIMAAAIFNYTWNRLIDDRPIDDKRDSAHIRQWKIWFCCDFACFFFFFASRNNHMVVVAAAAVATRIWISNWQCHKSQSIAVAPHRYESLVNVILTMFEHLKWFVAGVFRKCAGARTKNHRELWENIFDSCRYDYYYYSVFISSLVEPISWLHFSYKYILLSPDNKNKMNS